MTFLWRPKHAFKCIGVSPAFLGWLQQIWWENSRAYPLRGVYTFTFSGNFPVMQRSYDFFRLSTCCTQQSRGCCTTGKTKWKSLKFCRFMSFWHHLCCIDLSRNRIWYHSYELQKVFDIGIWNEAWTWFYLTIFITLLPFRVFGEHNSDVANHKYWSNVAWCWRHEIWMY